MCDFCRHLRGLALLTLAALAGAGLYLLSSHLQSPAPPVKVACNQWLGYEPLLLANDHGTLDTGLIRLATLPSTTEVIRALQHGAADAATLTLDEALTLAASGLPLTVVAVADVSAGADAVLLRSDLTDNTPLRGLRIGYEGTAVGAYVLSRFLSHHALELADVHLTVAQPDAHAEALETRTLDAVVTYEPFISRMNGLARPVFTSAALPGEIVDVLVVRTERATPEITAALRRAWVSGVSHLQSGDDAALAVSARRQGLSVPDLRQALTGIRFPLPADQAAYLNGVVPALGRQASDLWAVMTQARLTGHGTRFPTLAILPWAPADGTVAGGSPP
ncbi:ABC transporter substrate-binding protein [Novispirillum itersonii]|uniref:ABC transporter substrate-binding protein n=1 Tax=Novispirillum itersonii TaxID=189 RepID=UPI00161581F1|nr:ABC transporter substrate-binding protein [Novispirillum itersonii]